jgi:hypothetical protein
MRRRDINVFPQTYSDAKGVRTIGGLTAYEQGIFQALQGLLANPNVKIEDVDAKQVTDLMDRIWNQIEK